jgi:protein ImuA
MDLSALRRQVQAIERQGRGVLLPIAPLAHALPGGGLSAGLCELQPENGWSPALGFGLGLAASLLAVRPGPLIWVVAPGAAAEAGLPYAPGLAGFGIAPERLLLVRPACLQDALWALEQAAGCAGAGVVLAALPGAAEIGLTPGRRLHRAAERAGLCLVAARLSSGPPIAAAGLRLRVGGRPSVPPDWAAGPALPPPGAPVWSVQVERARGGPPSSVCLVEWDHATHRLRRPAGLVARPAPAVGGARSAA